MNLKQFSEVVSKIADTEGTGISVAEVSRVQSCFFAVFSCLPASEANALFAKGLERAEKANSEATKKAVKAAKRQLKKVGIPNA